ncbi:hypothetical protein ADN00_12260 [Ornatilinea apprima]|uniref:Uncharacterized protein n=1 Tax=Ornatilinea apprima TaxID=1134406 RepID=A0A0P6XT01_9CHLR|nr:hypothetical protein ADN00_12260 [Ornatilinea apprima]
MFEPLAAKALQRVQHAVDGCYIAAQQITKGAFLLADETLAPGAVGQLTEKGFEGAPVVHAKGAVEEGAVDGFAVERQGGGPGAVVQVAGVDQHAVHVPQNGLYGWVCHVNLRVCKLRWIVVSAWQIVKRVEVIGVTPVKM